MTEEPKERIDVPMKDTAPARKRTEADTTSPPVAASTNIVVLGTYSIFALSGAAGLIYEISWSRQIGLLFGHGVHAAAVVLAAFFAGMAFGHALGGRWASRLRPLLGYSVAEFVVAGWALVIPLVLGLRETTPLIRWLSSQSPFLQTALRALFCLALLLPATTALGTTLPLIAEFFSPARGVATPRVSLAYALNTAGAVTGIIAATAFLLLIVGVEASSYLAAALSAACGFVGCMLARFRNGTRKSREADVEDWGTGEPREQSAATGSAAGSFPVVWLAALSGFGALGLEVLYTRMFALVFHNSTYTFGLVVAVFLAGLALGAAVVSRLLRRCSAERLMAWSAALGSVSVLLSALLFLLVTRLESFRFGESFLEYLAGASGLVTLVVLPPVALLGMLLPSVWKAAEIPGAGGGAVVGRLTAANTLAAAAGALAASFLFLPAIGLWGSVVLVAALFYTAAVVLLWRTARVHAAGLGLVFAVLAAQVIVLPESVRQDLLQPSERLLRRWNGPYGPIELVRDSEDGTIQLLQNLHYGLGTAGEDSPHYRQGELPVLLHETPQDVLFLGLGTGMTAGGAVPHREVENVVVVEMVPDVVRAARRLAEWNNGVVSHPKVEIRIDDSRHYLSGTPHRFDVIVSDLFVPWQSQTGYLYTVEHYEVARRRLKTRGLFCQWLPLYQMSSREFELIADSFASVFPHTTLWWGLLSDETPILGLIGSERPLELRARTINGRLEMLNASSGKTDDFLGSARDLFFLYAGKWSRQSTGHLNTDEHPRVEFLAPLAHRNRKLLRKDNLCDYYDRVLAELPVGRVRFRPGERPFGRFLENRRAWQRWALFPANENRR